MKQSIIIFVTLIFFALSVSAVTCSDCASCNSAIQSAPPGATVYLDTPIIDHGGNCIYINRSAITFDCQGNMIDGTNSGKGINIYANYNEHLQNVKIKNCITQEFYFGIDIYAYTYTITQALIDNVTVSDNAGYGMLIHGFGINNSDIINSIFNNNGDYGLYISRSRSNQFENITSNGSEYGLFLFESLSNNFNNLNLQENLLKDFHYSFPSNIDTSYCSNTFSNIIGSGGRDIIIANSPVTIQDQTLSQLVLCNADNSNIMNITFVGSSTLNNNGFYAYDTDNSFINDINSSNNYYGIYFRGRSSTDYSFQNTFENIIANSNTKSGFRLEIGQSNTLRNITVSDNSDIALYLYSCKENNITSVNAYSNNHRGVSVTGNYNILTNIHAIDNLFSGISLSSYNNLTSANCSNNKGRGLDLCGSTYNRIISINCSNNTQQGIYLTSGTYNNISNSEVSNNAMGGIVPYRSSYNHFENITVQENTYGDIDYSISNTAPTQPSYCNNTFQNIIGSGGREIIVATESINLQNKELSELILCNADGSSITNVTVKGSDTIKNNGIYLYFVDNSNFNIINSSDSYYGIYFYGNSGNLATNNTFNDIITTNHVKKGFYINYAENTSLIKIRANNNSNYGIYAYSAAYTQFNDVISSGNTNDGIFIGFSNYFNIQNATASDNSGNGISLSSSDYGNLSDVNLDSHATSNGLYCLSSDYNNIWDITATNNSKGIFLYYATYNNLSDLICIDNSYGISLNTADNNNISSLKSISNSYGVELSKSDSNIIENSLIENNSQQGIYIATSSGSNLNNTLTNITSKNNLHGIYLGYNADNNQITDSHIENNDYGIYLYESSSYDPEFNYIYNNYFNNTQNYFIDSGITNPNYWNTTSYTATNIIGGPSIGGNYWANLTGDGFSQTCSDSEPDGFCDAQYNISDDGLNIDYLPLILYTSSSMPTVSNFESEETTNFSDSNEVPDITNVTNMTLATEDVKIQFPENYSVNAEGEDYDINIIFGDCFVSVNSSALDLTFNATAYLSLNNSDGHCGDNSIYTADGFHQSKSAIQAYNTRCTECDEILKTNGSITQFRVPHFSSYAIGSNARLDIYDEYEASSVDTGIDIAFYANYTDKLSGDHIGGAECYIEFDDNATSYLMTNNGANHNYTKTGGFASPGLHSWNVTCSNATGGWNSLNATDDIQINGTVIPEFSAITLGLGLIAVLAGLLIIRRKN
ncbi:MAG: NosD domain-containing protein [Nanoarchaeota archaeon]|nr:NosD domain-containing protein [Nanoarchaeota archaeon]